MIKLLMYDATITHEISTTYFCAIPTHTIETKQNKKTNVPSSYIA